MIHFIYLIAFGLFVSTAFAILSSGTLRSRIIYGAKTFAQFVLISLALAWLLYFVPW